MSTRPLLRAAADRLERAGVPSPAFDAAELLAHVLGTTRGRLPLVEDVDPAAVEVFEQLLARRERREPLQHLTGETTFRDVDLVVGPGVFVPRPETEVLVEWALGQLEGASVVVDLCTGSGAIAASIAHEAPWVQVHAVELDPMAHHWATRNLEGTGVDLRLGDMADAFPDLDGTVDVVVCNPPYIPLGAFETVAPEAREHDPSLSLWSGEDGLDAMRVLERTAARLLRPGGRVGAEHADLQGELAPAVFAGTGRWSQVRDHEDLAGRPRYVTARLAR